MICLFKPAQNYCRDNDRCINGQNILLQMPVINMHMAVSFYFTQWSWNKWEKVKRIKYKIIQSKFLHVWWNFPELSHYSESKRQSFSFHAARYFEVLPQGVNCINFLSCTKIFQWTLIKLTGVINRVFVDADILEISSFFI